MRICPNRCGFTLIELLIVVAVVALLVSILVPSLAKARRQVRIVTVHSDLRQITLALDAYVMNQKDKLPPTRRACGTDINYQLPIELARNRYLAPSSSQIPQARMDDLFDPAHSYKYRAPGPIFQNGMLYDFPNSTWRPRAEIWVPDDFPQCRSDEGQYYHNRTSEPKCPVSYAVWSIGPDPESPKFPRVEGSSEIDESHFPLPRKFWCAGSSDTGLITHFRSAKGFVHLSP